MVSSLAGQIQAPIGNKDGLLEDLELGGGKVCGLCGPVPPARGSGGHRWPEIKVWRSDVGGGQGCGFVWGGEKEIIESVLTVALWQYYVI